MLDKKQKKYKLKQHTGFSTRMGSVGVPTGAPVVATRLTVGKRGCDLHAHWVQLYRFWPCDCVEWKHGMHSAPSQLRRMRGDTFFEEVNWWRLRY